MVIDYHDNSRHQYVHGYHYAYDYGNCAKKPYEFIGCLSYTIEFYANNNQTDIISYDNRSEEGPYVQVMQKDIV